MGSRPRYAASHNMVRPWEPARPIQAGRRASTARTVSRSPRPAAATAILRKSLALPVRRDMGPRSGCPAIAGPNRARLWP